MKYYIFALFALLLLAGGIWILMDRTLDEEANLNALDAPVEDTLPQYDPGVEADSIEWSTPLDTSGLEYKGDHILIDWELLSQVQFREEFNDEINGYIAKPFFHPSVQYLDGKKVIVKGFVIPLEEVGQSNILVLSAYPFSNCFFCGGAGPESVMDIKLAGKARKRYTTDAVTSFKGRLRLNDSDLYYLNYILEDAEEVK